MVEFEITEPSASDDDLLEAIANGEHAALRVLMTRHGRRVAILAERVLGSTAEADEIVQDVFVTLWQQAGTWRSTNGAKLSTWLYRVALNRSIDRKRRKRVVSELLDDDLPDLSPNGADHAQSRSMGQMLRGALDRLPPRQGQALMLFYYGEASSVEAASAMKLSQSAFEALLFRARRALKAALADVGISNLGDAL
jgi:RNA polymerase sigma-70 factor (ECF subfamily)